MGGEDTERIPDEIERELERTVREMEARARGAGGRSGPRGRRQGGEDRDEKRDRDRIAEERARERLARDREPAESILDEIDDEPAAMGVMGLAPDEASALTGGMRDALQRPENVIRLFAAGLGIVALLILLLGLRAELRNEATQTPGAPVASPTAVATTSATAAGSPIAQASPGVTGTATANGSFTKVSGPCNFAARFNDSFSFAVTNGALTLTQLSNGHVSSGTLELNGDFTTMADGQGYRGRVSGATAEGQHTYTADGCDEVYDFTMQLSGSLIPTATNVPSPTASAVVGTADPTASATTTSSPAAGTPPPSPAAGGGGPDIPLSALGVVLLVAALGLFWGGPRLAGRPAVGEPGAGGDPCATEKVRLAAAEAALDAANLRDRRIEELAQRVQSTQLEAAAKQASAAGAARGASSYQGADGKPVYTNARQRARIEAAETAAAAARAAADAARRAYEAAGAAAEQQAAGDELFRAHREHGDAKASLDACLRLVAATAPTPPPRPSGGATTTGGTGVGTGLGTSDGTRTRSEGRCTKGEKRNETTAEHRFFMHDVGNAEIIVESFKAETDDSHAPRFLEHLGILDGAFKNAKIARGLAGGEIVGPILDTIDFPDFLTYFGAMREKLDETMKGLLEQLRQSRRRGEYTIRYSTHHFLITCRTWEECDGEQFVAGSESTLALVRSVAASLGPEQLIDEEGRRRWIDGWLNRLRSSNDAAERRANEFRQACGR
jgi:hypothetical protein